jgi:tetratricopeptide (TPR) repeat protein
VRYVLEGSVQRGGNRLRVNVQLIDAETGSHLWAERFEKAVTDLFDMQDEIVSRLANTLKAELIEAEARRAERAPHPSSMDLYFQGRSWANKGMTPEFMAKARGFFERALVLDPSNIEALVGTALVNTSLVYLADNRAARMAEAEAVLIKALSVAPRHALAHMHLGVVQIYTNRADLGIAKCERALVLDRNLADAHAFIGLAKHFLGRGVETETHINEALRLSPHDPSAFRWMLFAGFAKLHLGADAEAVAWLRRGIEANRNYSITHFALAAALALVGAWDEARAAVQAGLALEPDFTIRRFRAITPSHDPTFLAKRERVYEGMGLAGVPAVPEG